MKQERWRAEWIDAGRGHRWAVSILQEGWDGPSEECRLGAQPAVLEWAERGALDPVAGAGLTLTLVSETDRQFYGSLYSVEPFAVRCDLCRDGELYWSGTLDPELYEEPYATLDGYEVQATFADFASLRRVQWGETGTPALASVISKCLEAAQLAPMEVEWLCSTKRWSAPVDFAELKIDAQNFYDEDGEAQSLRDVLEAVLKPFGLCMIQKGGKITIYDTNALALQGDREEIWWAAEDQRLGTGPAYSRATLTYSPYARKEVADGSIDQSQALKGEAGDLYMTSYDWTGAAQGFRLAAGANLGTRAPMELYNGAEFFRIKTIYSGNDEAGVIWLRKGWNQSNYNLSFPTTRSLRAIVNNFCVSGAIFSMDCGFVTRYAEDYCMKLTMDFLCDTRYNPFEPVGVKNEKGNSEDLANWCNFSYVPYRLLVLDDEGQPIWHWVNRAAMESNTYWFKGHWAEGPGQWGDAWLCYYDTENRKSKSGLGGWATNKRPIGYCTGELPEYILKGIEGERIDFPPEAGRLQLWVGTGLYQFDYGREEKDIYPKLRWMAYKNPKITVVDMNGVDAEQEDIISSAWIERAAENELNIDTIVGTSGDGFVPCARGEILDLQGRPAGDFSRAGESARLEQLLLGTAFSLYGGRKQELSGTCRLLEGFFLVEDQATEGKFIVLGEIQDIKADESRIKAMEITADDYAGIEWRDLDGD